jgi:hypothetical protein
MYIRAGTKISSDHPLIIKLGISSKPTEFYEQKRRLAYLILYISEVGMGSLRNPMNIDRMMD